jgi:hypothetical protein
MILISLLRDVSSGEGKEEKQLPGPTFIYKVIAWLWSYYFLCCLVLGCLLL